jgi:hypothetical protein
MVPGLGGAYYFYTSGLPWTFFGLFDKLLDLSSLNDLVPFFGAFGIDLILSSRSLIFYIS